MKKVYIFILLAVFIIAVAVWGVLYSLLSSRIDNATRQGFINDCETFLLTDDNFISNYGNLISLTSNDDMPTEIEKGEHKQYYMNFVCTTDRGEFDIRVYLTFENEWTYSYEDLIKNK